MALALERGDLLITVGATGTVEPEEVVDIGAQVLGRIKELGVDPAGTKNGATLPRHVDYGSRGTERDDLLRVTRVNSFI